MYTQANVERDFQATANAKDSLAWGTKIVGGVIPGRTGEHLGLPVLPSVRQVRNGTDSQLSTSWSSLSSNSGTPKELTLGLQAMEHLKPDATGIYVAAHQAPGAIEEAIEAEVPLIVAVAEHIPVHDMLRVSSSHKRPKYARPSYTDTCMSRSTPCSRLSPSLDLSVLTLPASFRL